MRIPILIAFLLFPLACLAQVPLPADTLLKMMHHYPKPDTNRVQILNQLAFANYYADPVLSLRYGYEARAISDSLKYSTGEAEAFRQIGLAFWAQGDMATAISYFLTGLRIAKSNNHKQVEANLLTNIGTAYNGQGNQKEALIFLNQSLAMQRELKNINREAVVLNNIGDAYNGLNDFLNARNAYSKAFNIGKENNYLLALSTNIRNLGNIDAKEGLYDSAMVKYNRGLAYAQKAKDNRGIILSYISMASVHGKRKNYSTAREYLTIALQAAQTANLRAFVRDSYEALSKLNEAQGNTAEAFRYLKLFTLYKDSLQNLRVLSDIAADRLRYETEQKQGEIELLQKEGELKATEIGYQRSQILIIGIGLAVSVIFLMVAFVSYKKLNTKNNLLIQSQAEIEKKNKLLSEQSDEMATLNEELRAQQDQVIAQRDELIEKNGAIEAMNQQVQLVNQNLEQLVHDRTKVLEDQNKRLTDYSFFNAHELRSPVASILGLVNLLQRCKNEEEREELLAHLDNAATRLDKAIRTINNHLQGGIQ
jgi:tetratricopeptide (TPR) repeat protein